MNLLEPAYFCKSNLQYVIVCGVLRKWPASPSAMPPKPPGLPHCAWAQARRRSAQAQACHRSAWAQASIAQLGLGLAVAQLRLGFAVAHTGLATAQTQRKNRGRGRLGI